MQNLFLIPAKTIRDEEIIKRSRFIATVSHAATVDEAKEFILKIKKEFTDASHNCWAYQAGPPGDTCKIGMSDDGEPHQTAGKPMLNVLIHCKAGEIVGVVTRYFGGTKLGTGGLVRAYSGVLKKAIDSVEMIEKVILSQITFKVKYNFVQQVKRILETLNANILSEEYKEKAEFYIEINNSNVNELIKNLMNYTKGTVDIIYI